MATTPPARVAIYGLDTDNLCRGIGNLCLNGIPVGAIVPGSRVTLTAVNNADIDIACAQYGGDILGRRQGGTVWTLTAEGIEVSLSNLRRALDLQGAVGSGQLPLGRRQSVATKHQLQFYGEGPQRQTRRWTFHQAILDTPPELLLGHEKEFCTLPLKFVICRTLTFSDDFCYGVIQDYA